MLLHFAYISRSKLFPRPLYQVSYSYCPIHFLAIHQEAARGLIKNMSEPL